MFVGYDTVKFGQLRGLLPKLAREKRDWNSSDQT